MSVFEINNSDRVILRDAAKKQLELSQTEKNKARVKEWYLHNELKGEKPLIHLEMGTFSSEILPQRLLCEGSFARALEKNIRMNYLNQELFDDDFVTPDYFGLDYDKTFRLFDIEVKKTHTALADGEKSVGHHFVPQINDLEDDFSKLKQTFFSVDTESATRKKATAEDAIGDILPVKFEMGCLYSVPTQMLVHIMSMESMMYNIMDYPELFLKMMDRITNDTIAYYRMLEEKGLILPTTEHNFLGNGSLCYTTELPNNTGLTTKDVWGFMDSQETVCISPQMFEEFIFPCYKKISAEYGLLSYGCCEPVDPIWDNCLSKLGNLRKLSISPWANEELMGEKLKGGKVIYFRKPSPNYLGVDKVLDEDALRRHIRKSLLAARGCKMEIAQRDVYTIHNDIPKAKRYIEIIREEIENHWV